MRIASNLVFVFSVTCAPSASEDAVDGSLPDKVPSKWFSKRFCAADDLPVLGHWSSGLGVSRLPVLRQPSSGLKAADDLPVFTPWTRAKLESSPR